MKRQDQPRALGELIGDGLLHRLAGQARNQSSLTEYLRESLEPELAAALLLATVHTDGTLVLTASSPAWAARLRFCGDSLLSRCSARQPEARRVRIRTARDTTGT